MEIKRDRYLNLLISKKHNGLIKVITGMRRCGKSYLLFTLFKDYLLSEGIEKSHIIEIAFDAYENKQYRDPDVLYPYLKEKIKDDVKDSDLIAKYGTTTIPNKAKVAINGNPKSTNEVKVTPTGRDVLFGKTKAELVVIQRKEELHALTRKKRKQDNRIPEVHLSMPIGGEDMQLFEELRRKRMQLALQRHLPPYNILNDKTLHEIARVKPTTLDALGRVQGIGEYGFDEKAPSIDKDTS